MNSEAVWNTLHRQTFWGLGGGAIVFAAISAIDIALWDIRGKALGVPAYQLLGGKTNSKLRSYASQIQFGWGPVGTAMVDSQDCAEATRKAMAEGCTCVKADPVGLDLQGNWMAGSSYGLLKIQQLRVAAICAAGGPDPAIIIRLHTLTDTDTAIQLGRELEQYRCFYDEEPTQPLNPKLYRTTEKSVQIPLATGERVYSRWGSRPFLKTAPSASSSRTCAIPAAPPRANRSATTPRPAMSGYRSTCAAAPSPLRRRCSARRSSSTSSSTSTINPPRYRTTSTAVSTAASPKTAASRCLTGRASGRSSPATVSPAPKSQRQNKKACPSQDHP